MLGVSILILTAGSVCQPRQWGKGSRAGESAGARSETAFSPSSASDSFSLPARGPRAGADAERRAARLQTIIRILYVYYFIAVTVKLIIVILSYHYHFRGPAASAGPRSGGAAPSSGTRGAR